VRVTPSSIRLNVEELGFELLSLPQCLSKFVRFAHQLIAYYERIPMASRRLSALIWVNRANSIRTL
ncbi:hypothetical protein AAFX91_42210, partial [Bradyrhizobium sp. 31Argb]|uniref:hypothetical protein n=1 Tax=Bradyrhizobium sp. 31Argb TaxID=3141247 RepID=UPI0037486E27